MGSFRPYDHRSGERCDGRCPFRTDERSRQRSLRRKPSHGNKGMSGRPPCVIFLGNGREVHSFNTGPEERGEGAPPRNRDRCSFKPSVTP